LLYEGAFREVAISGISIAGKSIWQITSRPNDLAGNLAPGRAVQVFVRSEIASTAFDRRSVNVSARWMVLDARSGLEVGWFERHFNTALKEIVDKG
jgi:hypothetical protein